MFEKSEKKTTSWLRNAITLAQGRARLCCGRAISRLRSVSPTNGPFLFHESSHAEVTICQTPPSHILRVPRSVQLAS